MFGAILSHVSLLFTKGTPGVLIFLNVDRKFSFPFSLSGWLLILVEGHHMCIFTHLLDQCAFLLNTYGQEFIDQPFFLICVIGNFERSILWGKGCKLKCIRNDRISQSLVTLAKSLCLSFTWYARTPLMSINFIGDNLPIKVLANALSEDSNYASIAFINCLISSHSCIDPWILVCTTRLHDIMLKQLIAPNVHLLW